MIVGSHPDKISHTLARSEVISVTASSLAMITAQHHQKPLEIKHMIN